MTLSREKVFEMIAKNEISDRDAYEMLCRLDGHTQYADWFKRYHKSYRYNEPYLRDHTVFGEQVLLGVTHCSLAIDAVKSLHPERNINCIHRVMFSDPIVLKENEMVDVDVEINEKNKELYFKVIYKKNAQQNQRETASGEYRFLEGREQNINLIDKNRQSREAYSSDQLYAEEKEIRHGNSLHTVRRVIVGDKWALSELRVTDEMKANSYEYVIHPAIFDGAIIGSAYGLADGKLTGNYIPLMVQNIVFYGELHDGCACYAEMKKKNEEVFIYDCYLCDETGRVLVEMENVTLKSIKAKDLLNTTKVEDGHAIGITTDQTGDALMKRVVKKIDVTSGDIKIKINAYLSSKVKPLLASQQGEINDNRNFMDLGIDSSQLIVLVQSMEKDLGVELYPTLFFEHKNLKELTDYFVNEHKETFIRMLGEGVQEDEIQEDVDRKGQLKVHDKVLSEEIIVSGQTGFVPSVENIGDDDIAIIGMSGVFAGSRTLDEFWNNLKNKKNLITEIPQDHFDYHPWYDPNPQVKK